MHSSIACRHMQSSGMFQRFMRRFSHWIVGHSLKARLYLVIGFLGILPMIGVVNTYLALGTGRLEHTALDRATRGTILANARKAAGEWRSVLISVFLPCIRVLRVARWARGCSPLGRASNRTWLPAALPLRRGDHREHTSSSVP